MHRRRRGISPIISSILLIVIVVASSAVFYSVTNPLALAPQSNVPTILESLKIIHVSADESTISLFVLNRGGIDATVDSVYVESYTGELLLRQPVYINVPAGETVNITIPRGGLDLSKPLNFKIGTQRGVLTSSLAMVQAPITPFVPSLYEYFPTAYSITTGTYVTGILPDSVQHVDGSYFTIASAPSYTSPTYYPSSYNVQTGSYVNGTVSLLSSQDSQSMYFLSSPVDQIARTYNASGYNLLNGTLISGSIPDTYENDALRMTFSSHNATETIYPVTNMNFTSGASGWSATFSESGPLVGPSYVTNSSSGISPAEQRAVARTTDPNNSIHVAYSNGSYLRYSISVDGGLSFVDHPFMSSGTGAEPGASPSIASDINNNLHIAYQNSPTSPTQVRYLLLSYNSTHGGNPRTSTNTLNVTSAISLAAHFIAFYPNLYAVQLYVSNRSTGPSYLTVEVRRILSDGSPDMSPSGLLGSYSLSNVPTSLSWVSASFDLELDVGRQYALVLSTTGSGRYEWAFTTSSYVGSRGGWTNASGSWVSQPAVNFCFSIPGWFGWVASTPITIYSVASPTTIQRPAITVYPYLKTRDQEFATGTSTYAVYGARYSAQSFKPSSTDLNGVMLYLYRSGSPPDHLLVEIRQSNGSAPDMSDSGLLSSGYIDYARVIAATAAQWFDCHLVQPVQLNTSLTYWIVVKSPGSSSANYWTWYYNAAGGYANGNAAISIDGGSTWTPQSWDLRFRTYSAKDERPAVAWYYQAPTGTNRLKVQFLRCLPDSDLSTYSSWYNMAGSSQTPDTLYQASATADTRVSITVQPNTNNIYVLLVRSSGLYYSRIYRWNPDTGNWGAATTGTSILSGVTAELSSAPNPANNGVIFTSVSSSTGYTYVYYYTPSNTLVNISPSSLSMRNSSVSCLAGRVYIVYQNSTSVSYRYYDGTWSGEYRFYTSTSSSAPNAIPTPRASSVDFVWLNGSSTILYGSVYPTGLATFKVEYDPENGNPSGSSGGSLTSVVDEGFVDYSIYRANITFSTNFTTPEAWEEVMASFAWRLELSGSYSGYPYGAFDNVTLRSVHLILADPTGNDLAILYTDDNGGNGWTGTSVGYLYRTGIPVNYTMTTGTAYQLKVVFDVNCSDPADLPHILARIDDVGISFNKFSSDFVAEFYGTADTDDWNSIYINMISNVSAAPVNFSVSLYNYDLGRYPTSGEQGYFSFTANTPVTEEYRTFQITSGANSFRPSNGSWLIKVNGSSDLRGFQFGLNMLNFAPRVNVHSVSVEFGGTSDLDNWLSLLWNSTQAFSVPSVGVTIQLYNYSASAYPSSGFGYYSYTSGPAYTYGSASDTTSDNPTHFKDASGNWKILVTATKVGRPFHMLNDYILYSPTKVSQQTVDACFTFTGISLGNMLNMTYNVTSLFNASSVNVTFQIWDYSTLSWSTLYSVTYTSSPAPNTPENALIVVTSDLQKYMSSGESMIRVYAVKSQPSTLCFDADQIKLTIWAL